MVPTLSGKGEEGGGREKEAVKNDAAQEGGGGKQLGKQKCLREEGEEGEGPKFCLTSGLDTPSLFILLLFYFAFLWSPES